MTKRIKPDLDFINGVMASGGGDVKKCFQCATCSVVCNLSPDDKPYPRKEMVWTQWGLKEKLMGDPDIWLCHWCNDCSTHCPRGVKPGDVMAAIRSYLIRSYSVPGFLSRIMNDPKWFLALIAVPAVIIGVIWSMFSHAVPAGQEFFFHDMIPHWAIYTIYTGGTTLAALGVLAGIMRMWKNMNENSPPAKISIVESALKFVKSFATHEWFSDCGSNKARSWAHLLIFYGFLMLFIATCGAIYLLYVAHNYPPREGLLHPVKIIGNIGAVSLTIGCFWAAYQRISDPKKVGGGSFFDWAFLIVLGVVALTGIFAQFGRMWQMQGLAYISYYVHLIAVFYLLIYSPYTKFAHFIYRPVAMVHAGMRGRWRKSTSPAVVSVNVATAPAAEKS